MTKIFKWFVKQTQKFLPSPCGRGRGRGHKPLPPRGADMKTMEQYKDLDRPDKATGFASPALGYEAKTLDFNTLLGIGAPSVYCYRQSSRDMETCGIAEGSILIVDRAKKPRNGSIVIFTKDGSFFCREYRQHGKTASFTNGTDDIVPNEDTQICGVVIHSIRSFGGKAKY
jgi:DNA polymerase V